VGFTRDKFGLFFSLPLDEADFRNLNASGVRRVMLPVGVARHNLTMCAHLSSLGMRLTLRMADGDHLRYSVTDIEAIRGACAVETVIAGCEPDSAFDLNYGSSDWGYEQANQTLRAVDNVRRNLRAVYGTTIKVAAPALTMRSISEDEAPAPGRVMWAEVLRPCANACDSVGAHIYGYWYRSDVDMQRVKWAIKGAQELWHKPILIDEINFLNGSEREHIQGIIDVARMLEAHPLGRRVEGLFPFVSNGDASSWPPGYLLRDPAVYEALGHYVRNQ
jgi:hypothetical protein